MKRLLVLSFVILLALSSLSAENKKLDKESFFKEFYGTFIRVDDFRIQNESADLESFIKMVEEKYRVDIPASQENLFKTKEDVVEYINSYLMAKQKQARQEQLPKVEMASWAWKAYARYGLAEPAGTFGDMGYSINSGLSDAYNIQAGLMVHPYYWNDEKNNKFAWGFNYHNSRIPTWRDSSFTADIAVNDSSSMSAYFSNPLRHPALQLNLHFFLNDNSMDPSSALYLTTGFRWGQYKVTVNETDVLDPYHAVGLAAGMSANYFPLSWLGFEVNIMAYLDYVFRVKNEWAGNTGFPNGELGSFTQEGVVNAGFVFKF